MKQRIENYTQYKIVLQGNLTKEELLTTDSLQVAAIKLRKYALEYAQFLRDQRDLNQSAWLVLYVINLVEDEPRPKVVCKIGAVDEIDVLCMI